jgi:hypothetical protein
MIRSDEIEQDAAFWRLVGLLYTNAAPAIARPGAALPATDCEGVDAMANPSDERDRDSFIINLRVLADLLENIPEIPIFDHQVINFALDLEAFDTIEACARALEASGIGYARKREDDVETLSFDVGTIIYRFSTMTAARWTRSTANPEAGAS